MIAIRVAVYADLDLECNELPSKLFEVFTKMRDAYGIDIYMEVIDRSLLLGFSSPLAVVSVEGYDIAFECDKLDESVLESIEDVILRVAASLPRSISSSEGQAILIKAKQPPLDATVEVES